MNELKEARTTRREFLITSNTAAVGGARDARQPEHTHSPVTLPEPPVADLTEFV